MSQEAARPVPSLSQRLSSIEDAIRTSEGHLRQLRTRLEKLDKQLDESVTHYRDSKEETERLATRISACEDTLAGYFTVGDLAGVTALEKVRGDLIGKQITAREEVSSALHVLGQVSKEQQKYRQLIGNIEKAILDFTNATQACSVMTDADDLEVPRVVVRNGGRSDVSPWEPRDGGSRFKRDPSDPSGFTSAVFHAIKREDES